MTPTYLLNLNDKKKNILRLKGYSRFSDKIGYLVFELCESTLESLLSANLDERKIAKYTKDILEALQHMHKHNYIHRDLKLAVRNCLSLLIS